MQHHNALTWTALALVIIGAINWLLVGLFEWNLVAAIFGAGSVIARIIYVLVGISGVYLGFAEALGTPRTTTGRRIIP